MTERMTSRRLISKRPRGYSLIEILLAVAIVSMVMTAVAVSLRAMYRVDRQLNDNAAYGQVVPRLSLQLRTDAHAATDIVIKAGTATEPPGVVLTMATDNPDDAGKEVIQYQSNTGRVIRLWRREQELLGREVFYLGKTTTLQWRKIEVPSPMVELEITRATGKIDSEDSRQMDRVVAAIGIRIPREDEGAVNASNE